MSTLARIWITGPVKRLAAWCAAARAGGWEPIAEPLVEIEPQPFAWPAGSMTFDWLCVTSANALPSLAPHLVRLGAARVAVVGEATESALRSLVGGLPLEFAVGPCRDTKHLFTLWTPLLGAAQRVLWPRSDLAIDVAVALRGLGHTVAAPIAYANHPRLELVPPECDAVFFASPSAVHAYAANRARPRTHLAFAIGSTTAEALAALRADEAGRIDRIEVLDAPEPQALTARLGGA